MLSLTIHLETDLIIPEDRPGKTGLSSCNFEWQWKRWIEEIGDAFEIRGVYALRPWNLAKAIDLYSEATRQVHKPLYLQGDFHGMTFDGPFDSTRSEIDLVKQHDGLDGYVFYETANITRIDEAGNVEGSGAVAEILGGSLPG